MLPRFQHIIVPLDFTSKNQAALDIAFELSGQYGRAGYLVARHRKD